jgi:hypothetical protein
VKIALSTDVIIERDYNLEIFEMVSDIEREATIFTYSHQEGNILGPIELHQIRSSFLTHKMKVPTDFHKYAPLIPSAAKNLFIPCSTDLIFCVSRGFAQGIKKCENTPLIVYMVDDEISKMKKGFKNWFFKGYLKRWQQNTLKDASEVWFPSLEMAESFGMENDKRVRIVPLFFRVSEFPIIPSPVFTYDHVAIGTAGLTEELAKKFYVYYKEKGIPFKFVGDSLFLKNTPFFQSLAMEEREKAFFGERCAGELAPLLAGAGLTVDLSDNSFPLLTLQSLSTGRPVVSFSTKLRDYYYRKIEGKGVTTVTDLNFSSLIKVIEEAYESRKNYQSKELRANVNEFHDLKFKAELRRLFAGKKHHENQENCSTSETCC